MTKTHLTIALFSLMTVAACGDNLDSTRPDARPGNADAPPGTPDAPPGTPDAGTPDAAASTVTVVAGACATPDHTITNLGQAFVVDDATALLNPPMIFNVGDQVSIETGNGHNYASAPGTPAQFAFRSGALGEDACLTFTAEIPASANVDYICEAHPGIMTNTLVVLP